MGLACKYLRDGAHKKDVPDPKKAHNGTPEFTSRDAHRGCKYLVLQSMFQIKNSHFIKCLLTEKVYLYFSLSWFANNAFLINLSVKV